jgi:hypothetical protein
MAEEKTNEKQDQVTNEFVITRSKGFSYLTYLNIISKILIGDNEVTIETNKKWFYFVKEKRKTVSIDYKSITNIEVKTIFAFWDLLFSILFLFAFISSFDIWWLALIIIFLICSFEKNIIISLNNFPKIIIPADGIGLDKELIKNICEAFKMKTMAFEGSVSEKTESEDANKSNILDVLPFKTMVEEKLSPEKIENNLTLKKVMPHINLIGGVVAIIICLFLSSILFPNRVDGLIRKYDKLVDATIELVNDDGQDDTKKMTKFVISYQKIMDVVSEIQDSYIK